MRLFFIIISALIFRGYAKEKSLTDFRYTNSYTSDQIELNTLHLSYRNNRRDLLWPYQQEKTDAIDFGIDLKYFDGKTASFNFKGIRLSAITGLKLSPSHYLETSIGLHNLSKRTTTIPFEVKYVHLSRYLNGTLNVGRDLCYQDISLPGGYTQKLSKTYAQIASTITPQKNIRIPIKYRHQNISDTNQNNDFSADLLFGRSYPTWIWLGIGIQKISNSFQSSSHWTPAHYNAFGARFDLSYQLKDNIHLGWTLNINRSQEEENAWGYSYYNAFSFKYGDRNRWQMGTSIVNLQSQHDNQSWKQADFILFGHRSF